MNRGEIALACILPATILILIGVGLWDSRDEMHARRDRIALRMEERAFVQCFTLVGDIVYSGHSRRQDLAIGRSTLSMKDDHTGQWLNFVNMPCMVHYPKGSN